MITPTFSDLPDLLTKLAEKQRAIFTHTFGTPAQSDMTAEQTFMGDAREVCHALVNHPEAGTNAWIHAMEKTAAHAFSFMNLFDTSATPGKGWDATRAIQEYASGFHTISKEALTEMVAGLDGIEEKKRQRFLFYMLQWMEALSPSNSLLTNPELMAHTVKEGGGNLFKGFDNLLNDIRCDSGELSISMTDTHAFEVGKNLATTPGQVVLKNEVMELIQYAPSSEAVFKRPLLMVPPWINKYYILDLNQKNSMAKWLVEQGFTLFLISWASPDGPMENGTFEGYMKEGILAALDAITEITGEKRPHVAGYCTGGTLLATTLAWLAAKKEDRVASATFMATPIDFSKPGDLGVFIDEAQVNALISETSETGFLDGRKLAKTFNMLRPNDLIWSYVVKNYLKGEAPIPFDILYWNSDAANIPAEMYAWHLKNTYLENNLAKPQGVRLAGRALSMKDIKIPTYFLATVEDHIVLWEGVYKGARLMGGPTRFVLAESGHVAGVVNPPAKEKYGYHTNRTLPESTESWQENAIHQKGSWWLDWMKWLKPRSGKKVEPREPQEKGLGAAPGSFVKRSLAPKKRCRQSCSCQKPVDENAFPMAH